MVQTGKTVVPTAFSITYLEARDEDSVQTVREGSRATMLDMLKMDGFIGATTAKTGHRMVTISAWEDTESPRELMRKGAHAQAQKGMYSGEVATHRFTSVWTNHRMNPAMHRCDACGKMTMGSDDSHSCACGAKLPDPFPYW